MSELQLAGRTAVVTGAARGIGFHTSRILAARGCAVALVDRSAAEAEAAASRIAPRPGMPEPIGLGADVSDEDALHAALDQARSELGPIEVAIANAGIAQPLRPVATIDSEAFDRVLAVDLAGVVNTARLCLPDLIQTGGHITLVSSVYAFLNGGLQSSYAMSKAAVEQLGRALRVELGSHEASAGLAYFGFVDTDLVRGALEDPLAVEAELASPPILRKRIRPAQAAQAIVDAAERRQARTIRPYRWAPYFFTRGLINPLLDELIARDRRIQSVIQRAEQKGPN